MIRGTTPTHVFTLPFDVELIADLRISYGQNNGEIICKTIDDCTLNGNTISVTLTQEDTYKFNCGQQAKAQVKIRTHAGDVLASEFIFISVERCLNEEVI